jgi:hypothetical protein
MKWLPIPLEATSRQRSGDSTTVLGTTSIFGRLALPLKRISPLAAARDATS